MSAKNFLGLGLGPDPKPKPKTQVFFGSNVLNPKIGIKNQIFTVYRSENESFMILISAF